MINRGAFVQNARWMMTGERTRSIRERLPPPVSFRRFQRVQASRTEVRCRFSHAVPPFFITEAKREAAVQPPRWRNTGLPKVGGTSYSHSSPWVSENRPRHSRRLVSSSQRPLYAVVLQLAVADTFSNFAVADHLAESESLANFREFMTDIGIPTASITSTIDLLSSRHFASVHRTEFRLWLRRICRSLNQKKF